MVSKLELPGWGDDPLSEFLQMAEDNLHASFARLKYEFRILQEIHEIFHRLATHLDWVESKLTPPIVAHSHSAFLAGVRLALSGQAPSAFAVLRIALESALLANFLDVNQEQSETWLNRSDSETARKKSRNTFTSGALLSALRNRDNNIHARAKELYDRMIDYGGHVNDAAVLQHLEAAEGADAESDVLTLDYFVLDEVSRLHVLKTTAEAGCCILEILQLVFRERFSLLSLDARLDHAISRLSGINLNP